MWARLLSWFDDRDLQIERFQTQLDVALELDLPVIVHKRRVMIPWRTCVRLRAKGGRGCCTLYRVIGNGAEAIDFSFMVSFSGVITCNAQPLEMSF